MNLPGPASWLSPTPLDRGRSLKVPAASSGIAVLAATPVALGSQPVSGWSGVSRAVGTGGTEVRLLEQTILET